MISAASKGSRPPIATVLLVDDERNVTDGLLVMLRREPYEVLCAHSAAEAASVLARCHVDVVVSDERMPGMAGSEFLRQVAAQFPGTARILLTGNATLAVALKAINEGKICRLLCKPCPPQELTAAIADAVSASISAVATERFLQLARNENAVHGRVGDPATTRPRVAADSSHRFGALAGEALEPLSARELEVLALILDGQRVAQAAKALFISPHTARNHLKAIFGKLNVHSQVELLARSRAADPPE